MRWLVVHPDPSNVPTASWQRRSWTELVTTQQLRGFDRSAIVLQTRVFAPSEETAP